MASARFLGALLGVVVLTSAAFAQTESWDDPGGWLTTEEILATAKSPPPVQSPAEAGKGPPLPFHTIEGVAGGTITPMAYLSNPGPEGTTIGLPSVSFTYLQFGSKSVQTLAVTETFYRRIEVGYAVSRFYLGSLPHLIRKNMDIDVDRNSVYLHHLNLRAMLVEEDSFDLPLPAVSAGVHFKYNDGIRTIDNRLAGTLGTIGFERSNGVDFVVTASKTFPDALLGRPVMASLGVRTSQASQLGYLGFSDHWTTTLEANVVCLVTDWLALGYEFRQKTNPYHHLAGVIGEEHNWHALCAGWIVNEHLTIVAGWAYLGTMANSDYTNGVALQVKYEF